MSRVQVVLLGLRGIVLIPTIWIAVIAVPVLFFLKSSDLYEDTTRLVQSSPAIQKAYGQPIEFGFFFEGNIETRKSTFIPWRFTPYGLSRRNKPYDIACKVTPYGLLTP